jgi:hypothetical protein
MSPGSLTTQKGGIRVVFRHRDFGSVASARSIIELRVTQLPFSQVLATSFIVAELQSPIRDTPAP